jgi:hypothetical protein
MRVRFASLSRQDTIAIWKSILFGKESRRPSLLNSLQNKFPHHFGAEDFPDINSLHIPILLLLI